MKSVIIAQEFIKNAFDSIEYKALVNVLFTSYWLQGLLAKELEPYSISYKQYNILRTLKRNYPEPVNCSTLKRLLLEKNADITRITMRLQSKGHVLRKKDPANRRIVNIFLTDEGLQLEEQITSIILEKINAANVLSDEETVQLSYLLKKIRA
jgi:DNA-binding MarR family transcriptional regulator